MVGIFVTFLREEDSGGTPTELMPQMLPFSSASALPPKGTLVGSILFIRVYGSSALLAQEKAFPSYVFPIIEDKKISTIGRPHLDLSNRKYWRIIDFLLRNE